MPDAEQPRCRCCGRVVKDAAIIYCPAVDCQRAACRQYGVPYRAMRPRDYGSRGD